MSYVVIEFWGQGDPFFGGQAEDRPLGHGGLFLRPGHHSRADVRSFDDAGVAKLAAEHASNRRDGGIVSVLFEEAR